MDMRYFPGDIVTWNYHVVARINEHASSVKKPSSIGIYAADYVFPSTRHLALIRILPTEPGGHSRLWVHYDELIPVNLQPRSWFKDTVTWLDTMELEGTDWV